MTPSRSRRFNASIISAVDGVLAACDAAYGSRVFDGSVANQEYARAWARLALSTVADRPRERRLALLDLKRLARAFLVGSRTGRAQHRQGPTLAGRTGRAPHRQGPIPAGPHTGRPPHHGPLGHAGGGPPLVTAGTAGPPQSARLSACALA
jgi:hypothetical protein